MRFTALHSRTNRPTHLRLGIAAAEFALVAPLIGMIIYGMFEVTRGIMVKEILTDAARKACSTGTKPGKTDTDMKNEVKNILQTDNNIDYTQATVTVLVRGQAYSSTSPPQPGDKVSVQVSIPVSAVYWAGTIFLTNTEVESETVVMMRQG
jgi:Flp pilus assembly protein TadG